MPNVKDRIFVSIGVSRPRGGLDELPGAITAADRMASWARAQGYETLLIHDKNQPEVTVELLRKKITAVIQQVTNQTTLKRLVIFFAGHGSSQDVGDQLWLLTNWDTDWNEAIRTSSLQRVLEYYGPEQVSVIGDACQEVSSQFGDIIGSQVLKKTDEEPQIFELDQFFAVDYGKQAFMIKAKDDNKAFCLFTEVLLDALEGDTEENCFEEINGQKAVTSQSLARYLLHSVPRIAGKHGLLMTPRPKPGFYTDTVYLSIPETSGGVKLPPDLDHTAATLDNKASLDIELLGVSIKPEKDLPPHKRSVDKVAMMKPKPGDVPPATDSSALDQAREARRRTFIDKVGATTVRDHFETGCGICVSGTDVTAVSTSFGAPSLVDDESGWIRIELSTPADGDNLGWSDALVTLADERIVSACAIHTFVTALYILDDASISLLHHPLGADPYESEPVIDMLAQLHADLLTTEEIIDSAAMLRYGKHRFITVGCIAAQFYDAIRDVDSLRSMAAFYALNNQPVPLDIILYGGGKISEHDGRLYADIPAVEERAARTPQEESQRFTYMETPAFESHPIAGRIPWMRHAWGAIETARCDESAAAWKEQAMAAMRYLAPGTFTVARPDGGEAMSRLAGIRIDQGVLENNLCE